jgi:hypothetical protein
LRGAGDSLIVRRARFTRVYVQVQDRWQVVAAQATPIPQT